VISNSAKHVAQTGQGFTAAFLILRRVGVGATFPLDIILRQLS